MTTQEKTELRAALREAFERAIEETGLDAFKRMSWFGSSDPTFQAGNIKQAA